MTELNSYNDLNDSNDNKKQFIGELCNAMVQNAQNVSVVSQMKHMDPAY